MPIAQFRKAISLSPFRPLPSDGPVPKLPVTNGKAAAADRPFSALLFLLRRVFVIMARLKPNRPFFHRSGPCSPPGFPWTRTTLITRRTSARYERYTPAMPKRKRGNEDSRVKVRVSHTVTKPVSPGSGTGRPSGDSQGGFVALCGLISRSL